MIRAVIDTNVLIGAMLSAHGSNRRILRECLVGKIRPLVGQALLTEYEDVLSRPALFCDCVLSNSERVDLLNAILSVSEWVKIYFSWRPNLPDEADNHLVETAVAASADCIVTHNRRHIAHAELSFPAI